MGTKYWHLLYLDHNCEAMGCLASLTTAIAGAIIVKTGVGAGKNKPSDSFKRNYNRSRWY